MTDNISPKTTRDTLAAKGAPQGEPTNLSYQYGSIGIQAVAAAARYADIRKTPAEAHAAHRIDQRFVESAV
jgi:hypothetical protein